MIRVEVKPELLRWASQRSGIDWEVLERKFPKLDEWERGEARPTMKQLERFAKRTYTPVGYFFLPEPPVEEVPIPDFRTIGNDHLDRPSADLLDTIYVCQQRQEWYRDFARTMREEPRPFVGSVSVGADVVTTAGAMRQVLGFDLEERRSMATWAEALRRFVQQADALGILVMTSGVVGSNTSRKLNPQEFRGFALADELAPLIFINGADTKSAQMFTLAHELVHLWSGSTAVSDTAVVSSPSHNVEVWCNRVAAELLVPLDVLRRELRMEAGLDAERDRLARRFKVSTLVILRRIADAGGLTPEQLWDEYQRELQRLLSVTKRSGGSFYSTQASRVGKRFARALVVSTLEGQTLRRDAFRMLGISKASTFDELGRRLGVTL